MLATANTAASGVQCRATRSKLICARNLEHYPPVKCVFLSNRLVLRHLFILDPTQQYVMTHPTLLTGQTNCKTQAPRKRVDSVEGIMNRPSMRRKMVNCPKSRCSRLLQHRQSSILTNKTTATLLHAGALQLTMSQCAG